MKGLAAATMQIRRVQLANGRVVEFELPGTPQDRPASFVLGVRKCGSSVMNSMLMALAAANGTYFLDVGGIFFKHDVAEPDWRDDSGILDLLASGVCYGGFRSMPAAFLHSPIFRDGGKILLLRDPRDALVSEYFSVAYTHDLPDEAAADGVRAYLVAERARARRTTIDAFAIRRATALNDTMMAYRTMLTDRHTKLFLYEDVILQKRAWLIDMAAHLHWPRPTKAALDAILAWADILPAEERPREFVRRVRPGDHLEKLTQATRKILNRKLAPAMALFGYR